MRRRTFGSTDLETSAVGFGTWALGSDWWGEHESPDALVARALVELVTDVKERLDGRVPGADHDRRVFGL